MKPQYFIAILFGTSLYWMYLLYAPFLIVITIAALLAVSTSTVYHYIERKLHSRLAGALLSSLLLALMFFAPLGYFLASITIWLNHLEPDTLQKVEHYIRELIINPPEFLLFIKPYFSDSLSDVNIQTITANALSIAAKIGAFSAGFLKNAVFGYHFLLFFPL